MGTALNKLCNGCVYVEDSTMEEPCSTCSRVNILSGYDNFVPSQVPEDKESKSTDTILILVRGIPGSGKSTLAANLAQSLSATHLETDMYFVNDSGEYIFNRDDISKAHGWCLSSASEALEKSLKVIVSNTFVQMWEMKPYISLAAEINTPIQIIEATGFWKSTHDVPDEVIKRMISKWEPFDREQVNGWERPEAHHWMPLPEPPKRI